MRNISDENVEISKHTNFVFITLLIKENLVRKFKFH